MGTLGRVTAVIIALGCSVAFGADDKAGMLDTLVVNYKLKPKISDVRLAKNILIVDRSEHKQVV